MENWREGSHTGHTHEAHDVTLQLDGRGRQPAELPGEPAPPDSSDGPVFVDESGRRSKTYRRLGWVLASLCAAYAVTLVFAVLGGNSTAPWLPLSGPNEEAKAEEAEVRPVPSASVAPSGDPEPDPGPSGTPEPGASGSVAPSAAAVTVPAGSAGRTPSASPSVPPTAATGGSGSTKPAPTTSAAKPSAEASPSSTEPEPTVSTSAPAESPEPPVQEESAL